MSLLLLPVAPAMLLYAQISDQLAAESIARHAVRAAMLSAELGQLDPPDLALQMLSQSWEKQLRGYSLSRQGDLVSLEVQVGNASAIATLGIEPTR